MRTVSLSFVLAITVLGVAAVTLSYLAPSPLFQVMALALAFYGLHLIALRTVIRGRPVPAGGAEIASLRAELEEERAKLSAERAELQSQKEAAEQQWKLLREMVRERVEKSHLQAPAEARATSDPIRGSSSDGMASGRADVTNQSTFGRW